MKQLLFLLLFPCLATAQYQGNGNQKITLGEQTTADGLVYRGVANDTNVITPFSDTSAYIILDTVNSKFYHYNRTTTYWSLAGGGVSVSSFSGGSTGLTPSTATTGAVTLGGTLAVANGGTGTGTAFTQGSVVFAGASGTYTQDNSGLFFDNTNNRLGINTAAPEGLLEARSTVGGTNNGLFSLYENSGTAPYFILQKARGTVASPTAVQLNDGMGELAFRGYTNSGFDNAVVLRAYNYLAPGAVYLNGGFKILINSQANGGLVEYLNIISNGNTGIGGNLIPTERLHVGGNARIAGNIAAGVTSATASLHLAAGTATAGTAPLKFTSGTNLTTPEAGVMEFNGTNLFFSPSTTRHTVNHGLTGSATLDFLSTNAQNSRDMTIAVTGAADGDVVSLGVPNAAVNANTSYSAWVSAANTVTVRFNNYSSGTVDPASGLFKVFVTK